MKLYDIYKNKTKYPYTLLNNKEKEILDEIFNKKYKNKCFVLNDYETAILLNMLFKYNIGFETSQNPFDCFKVEIKKENLEEYKKNHKNFIEFSDYILTDNVFLHDLYRNDNFKFFKLFFKDVYLVINDDSEDNILFAYELKTFYFY